MLQKIKSLFGAQDMTVGKPMRSILLFTVPLLVGNVLQLMYNTVDSIVVGQYSGPNGLGAIGVSTPIQLMFAVFFMTVGTGVSVMVSQYFGAKDKEKLSMTVGNSLLLILIATLLATFLGLGLSDWILRITKCPPEVFENAKAYLMIMFLGFVGMGFYNILGGILRGFGDAMFPLVVLAGTTVLNILLDIWMVATPEQLPFGLGLGVAGAAWATIIAQTLSAVVCLWRLLRMKRVVEVTRATMKLDAYIVKTIVRIGIPSGLQMMIMSMSFMFVQRLINSIQVLFNGVFDGAIFVAVNTAVTRVDGFAMMPAQTFNQVSSTFTGQNIGAEKLDRASRGLKITLVMALVVAAVVFAVIQIWGGGLMRMFINDSDPARSDKIVEIGIQMMRIICWAYPIMAIAMTIGGAMRGAGDTIAQLWIMIATNIAFRIPLTVLLVHLSKSEEYPNGAPSAIYLSMIIAFGLNVTATCIYFATGKWKTKSVVRRKPGAVADI
ncbi:MAG: MATE family efflux transporter [Oscillospiraceae bacterium]|jgi:putative MATE family efflux protein|nr:MATE family efflux transporter [Oscillospiraceae bacterium]